MSTVKEFVDFFGDVEDKEAKLDYLLEEIEAITTWYIKRSFLKGENELLRKFFKLLNTKEFFKTFKAAAKEYPDYCMAFVTVVGDFLENAKHLPEEYQADEALKAKYIKVLTKLLKSRSREIAEETLLPADLIINLLVVMPTPNCISSEKYIGLQVARVNRKIYNTIGQMEEFDEDGTLDTKQFKILYTELFGKDMLPSVALSILLEKKQVCKDFNERQLKVYNIITRFALKVIEKSGKETCKDVLAEYARRRNKDIADGRDVARRVQLTQLDAEEYPKIAKVVSKICDMDEKYKEFM